MNAKHASMQEILEAAGGQAKLARALKIGRSAVNQWEQVPIRRAREVAVLTGIPVWRIRPDIWEPPTQNRAA